MITIYYRSIDDPIGWTVECETVQSARDHLQMQLGKTMDIGTSYAVGTFGDVTATIDGCTWDDIMRCWD